MGDMIVLTTLLENIDDPCIKKTVIFKNMFHSVLMCFVCLPESRILIHQLLILAFLQFTSTLFLVQSHVFLLHSIFYTASLLKSPVFHFEPQLYNVFQNLAKSPGGMQVAFTFSRLKNGFLFSPCVFTFFP